MQETRGTELVPTRVPIIGTREHISNALRLHNERRHLLTDPATIKPVRIFNRPGQWREQWRVDVDLLMPAPVPAPPAPAPAPRRPATTVVPPSDSVGAALAKALGFVGVLFALFIGAGFVLYLLTRDLIHSEHVFGAVGFLVIGLLFAGTRVNHAGACPGIPSHCKGCRY